MVSIINTNYQRYSDEKSRVGKTDYHTIEACYGVLNIIDQEYIFIDFSSEIIIKAIEHLKIENKNKKKCSDILRLTKSI